MDTILKYMTNSGTSPVVAKRLCAKLSKHEDIYAELLSCIEGCGECAENGLVVNGYSAKDIQALAPFMNLVGVYGFLVSLRENPESSLETIKAGFPRK